QAPEPQSLAHARIVRRQAEPVGWSPHWAGWLWWRGGEGGPGAGHAAEVARGSGPASPSGLAQRQASARGEGAGSDGRAEEAEGATFAGGVTTASFRLATMTP